MAAAVLFTAGAWLLQQQAVLPPRGLVAVVLALFVVSVAARRSTATAARTLGVGIGLVAWAGAGFLWAAVVAHLRLADELPAVWEGRDIRIEGVVAGLPERTDHGWRFGLTLTRVIAPDAHVPRHLLLSLYAPEGDPVLAPESPFEPGERIAVTVRLKRPHALQNPHGFDAEAWLFERGIRATGYVRDGSPVVHQGIDAGDLAGAVDRWRLRIRDHMNASLPASPLAGVLVALAIGDQQGIDASRWQLYTRTGVNHLMSISGLHITMLAAGAAWLAGLLWRRLPARLRAIPASDAAGWAGLLTAFVYAVLAGFAVPAQRTLWMLTVVVLARTARVSTSPWDILGLALGAVMLLDPMAVIAPGFWLSFGAVALLMFAASASRGEMPWWRAWGRTQWVLFLGLAPLLLAWFQQVSIVSPIANAVAVPVVSLVVVPLALLAAVLPTALPAEAAHGLLVWLHRFLQLLSDSSAAVYVQHAPTPGAVLLACVGVAWMLMPRGMPSRWLGGVLVLPLVFTVPAAPQDGEAWVTMLDVGQGLATVVRTREATLVFDAGPAWSHEADSGGRIVAPTLRAEGLRTVQTLVVSHDDRDHSGGVRSLSEAVAVDTVLTPLPRSRADFAGVRRVLGCVAGQTWTWSGVRFEMLSPSRPDALRSGARDNATSCVLKVTTAGASLLIAADIERDVEANLVAEAARLKADLLIAPHHGSRTSSTAAFVSAVAAREVWFAVGYRNRFGHPHDEVVSRYRASGARSRRSDADGAVMARLDARGFTVKAWRPEAARYWHDRWRGG
ncbi:MAG: DNA internalization-related competence protein ComEC/Rec2 [Burkholderiales bacterium]